MASDLVADRYTVAMLRCPLITPILMVAILLVDGARARGTDIPVSIVDLVESNCVECHSGVEATSNLDLEQFVEQPLASHLSVWERVVRKLRTGQMPPRESYGPPRETIDQARIDLESALEAVAVRNPRVGSVGSFRRMTRFEYGNAIRDLLAIDIDVETILPADEASHGFDNVTVNDLSPTLLNRYVSAAQRISRMAMGRPAMSPGGKTYRVRPDVTQDVHVDGLPIGTRGGMRVEHFFTEDGDYEITIRLTRDRNEHVEGLNEPHQIEVLLDRERAGLFTVRPPRGKADPDDPWSKPTHANVDRHLKLRFPVTAGKRELAVTFLRKPESLLETARQPLNVHYNMYRHPRLGPAVYQVSVTGPYDASGPGETESRRRIFVRYPRDESDQDACAEEIIEHLLRRAGRQSVNQDDLVKPMSLYREARAKDGFEAGIEMALSAILVHPKFLFRIETEPRGVASGQVYKINDWELASRLSFFLWSSLPDDELLAIAQRGELSSPENLEAQVRRMLADPRSQSLVTSFVSQWLYLRNLDAITPDSRLYPDFDDNLRQAFRRETELFVEAVIREDRPVVDLLRSDHTFLNERLAKHYGIRHVYGSRFRRVQLDPDDHRGGLLRHGSVLTVTSYATRTSPVLRGKWVLENLLGTPPPPPPPDVPDLADNVISSKLSLRQRLAQHRADPACATCHNLMDPIGFALENYDAVGRWRSHERDWPVDATGGLPSGQMFDGIDGLEAGLVARPEVFVETLTEKLLTYALGRGVEPVDGPAIRRIVRDAKQDEYRFASLILGIVRSSPFQMRTAQ